jgi:tyramine---L-glutamate ligase
MRILVYEFASGGGFAGQPVPASLAREGLAMRTALVADLAAIDRHEIVTTTDIRFNQAAPPGVDVVPLLPGDAAMLDALMASADAVWLVAPETDRCLERLAARVERKGKKLLGPGAAVIRRASDKGSLPRRLARVGVRHPQTYVLAPVSAGHRRGRPGVDARMAARQIGYPIVVKPGRGAGSQGVRLVRHARELRGALDAAHRANGTGSQQRFSKRCSADLWGEPFAGVPAAHACAVGWRLASRTRRVRATEVKSALVMQRYVPGTAASVSLLADGRHAVALAVNAQRLSASSNFCYHGGRTPFDHPLAAAAADAAVRTCAALPGLRGYVGVDLVLTASEVIVIEVNPRLTTAYLGVRAAFDENLAALALAACEGILPLQPIARRRVRFTAAGRVRSA